MCKVLGSIPSINYTLSHTSTPTHLHTHTHTYTTHTPTHTPTHPYTHTLTQYFYNHIKMPYKVVEARRCLIICELTCNCFSHMPVSSSVSFKRTLIDSSTWIVFLSYCHGSHFLNFMVLLSEYSPIYTLKLQSSTSSLFYFSPQDLNYINIFHLFMVTFFW